ncbi:nuclear pore complex protein NUP1-like isoform X2 [Aristolochia californica]|uniref:nuclear pore complex protein NUP1-like isoform X2 n=1 Tax=Aristolochia californica TaxID=171875 RepID=UPI0035DBAE63
METAATGSYDGGVGGKFRRRPTRRAATPYDRPPPALRNPDGPGRNGWLSKLVDPASRIIADSASKIFQSVFRRRLPALPESNQEASHEPPTPVCDNQSLRQQEGDNKNVKDSNGSKLVCNGINEFEQLLKHKTFTRDEFDLLTDLLRSRTIDLSATDEKLRSADDDKKRTEPSTSQNLPTHEEQERQNLSAAEKGLGTFGLRGRISTPGVGLNEVTSPTEVAKEFMGSRPLRVSPTTLGLRNQALREDPTFLSIVPLKTPRLSNMSFTPRSSHLLLGNGYVTPRPRGRSAIYNMARSPHIKGHSAVAWKGPDVSDNDYGGSTTVSPWTSNLLSGGKQALKRRGSVLDADFGSGGPIRRIRQKSNLMTPLKSTSSPPRTPMGPLGSDAQMLAELDRPTELQSTENEHERMAYTSVPPQSSEMARKILQQLDKLVPSPKDKSSEQKLAVDREKSPSKLTTDMLSEQALTSMEGIDLPKFQLTQSTWGLGSHGSGMDLPGPRNDFPRKHDKVEENGPSKLSLLGANLVSEIGVVESVATLARDTASSSKVATAATLRSDPDQLPSKRAFHMSAPEVSLDMDEDNCIIKAAAMTSSANEKEKIQASKADLKAVATEAGNASFESSKNAATSVPCQGSEKNEKALDGHPSVAGKDVGFAFPTIHAPDPLFAVPSMHSGQSFSLFDNKPSVQKDQQNGHPAFDFGTKSVNKENSVTFRLPASVIPKFGAASDTKAETLDSKSMAPGFLPVTSPQSTGSDKSEEFQKANNLFRLSENVSSPALSSSTVQPVFAFGASTSSTQSNGVLSSSTTAVSVAATSTMPVFGSMSARTTSSTSSPSMAASSSIFKFGSGISASSSPNLISHTAVASGTKVIDSVVKNKSASTFSAPGSSASTGAGTTAFAFGATATSNAVTASSSSNNQTQGFGTFGSTTSVSLFASQGAPFTRSVGSEFGSYSSSTPSFGLNASSSFGTTGSIFGSSNSAAKPLGSGSGIVMNPPVSFASGSSSSFMSVSTSTSLFGSSSQLTSSTTANNTSTFGLGSQSADSTKPSTLFGSTSQPGNSSTASLFGSSFQSAGSTSSIFGSGSQPASSTASIFGSSSQPACATASIFGSSSKPASATASIFGSSSLPASSSPIIFGTSSQPASSSPSIFGTSSQPVTSTSNTFGSSSQPANSTSSLFGLSSQPASSTTGIFGSNSQPASSSVFTFGSSSPSSSTGFSFGSSSMPTGSGPLTFGSSSMPPTFSFNSSTSGTSTTPFSSAHHTFHMSNAPVSFGAAPPSNDQINVEDSMAEDTVQATTAQAVSSFDQAASSPSPFMFGSTSVQSGGQQVFQFGGQAAPQNASSPFAAAAGNLEVAPGGSFSLGTAGSDKSNRKIVRVRRERHRKK